MVIFTNRTLFHCKSEVKHFIPMNSITYGELKQYQDQNEGDGNPLKHFVIADLVLM